MTREATLRDHEAKLLYEYIESDLLKEEATMPEEDKTPTLIQDKPYQNVKN
jgi:hypothetical protein